ncbi:MAG: peptide-methionine (S)-S-oxide reductase [Opitutaceae bacterium]|nr:peptide-methionine (S)-S-oxide reductase [Opitutaceae bacterium]|tara:strand:+ start:9680 stop:10216 length:537 start_codon:yes stop_codon:yes gene_type:complete
MKSTDNNQESLEMATLGGGCFWCVEAIFQQQPGVTKVVSGYAGGEEENPTYQSICSGTTGHAEVIQITFDPKVVSYNELLHLFWRSHDPTTLNRQGNDVGTQYRSTLLYHSNEQRNAAEKSREQAQEYFEDPIVTEITALEKFYPGEDYHQDYYLNNPQQGYCSFVIRPKLEKLGLKH